MLLLCHSFIFERIFERILPCQKCFLNFKNVESELSIQHTHTRTPTKSQEHVSHNWCDHAVKIWEWWKYVWTVPREGSIVTVAAFHFGKVVLWQMRWWEAPLTAGQPWQRDFSLAGNKANEAQKWFFQNMACFFCFFYFFSSVLATTAADERGAEGLCNICGVPVRVTG